MICENAFSHFLKRRIVDTLNSMASKSALGKTAKQRNPLMTRPGEIDSGFGVKGRNVFVSSLDDLLQFSLKPLWCRIAESCQ